MERRRLGRTAVEVSRLGLGGAPLGNLFRAVTEVDARDTVLAAWAAGLRYFDTAPLYGHGLSERRLGAALRDRPRGDFVLSTKVGRRLEARAPAAAAGGVYVDVPPVLPVYDYGYEGTLRSVEASLDRLGLDRVDVLFVHDVGAHTHGADGERTVRETLGGAVPALERLRREARVRAIGVGVNEWQVAQRMVEAADLDCVLLAGRYSLLEQGALETFLPLCARRGVGVIIGGAFNSGILATGAVPGAPYNYAPAPPGVQERVRALERVCAGHGVPLAAAALQFPLAHPAVAAVVVGARSAAEVARDVMLAQTVIPGALWRDLRTAGLIHAAAPTPED
jgi:D-threo-aldose 1-dehydrogenase